jgi:hypothetical protein
MTEQTQTQTQKVTFADEPEPVTIIIAKTPAELKKELEEKANQPYVVSFENTGFPYFCRHCHTGTFSQLTFNMHCNSIQHLKMTGEFYMNDKK